MPAIGAAPALNLALHGGGAHGAFPLGVLEDGRFGFEGLSGSSAGAPNAVLFAEGWRRGKRHGARRGGGAAWLAENAGASAGARRSTWPAASAGLAAHDKRCTPSSGHA